MDAKAKYVLIRALIDFRNKRNDIERYKMFNLIKKQIELPLLDNQMKIAGEIFLRIHRNKFAHIK